MPALCALADIQAPTPDLSFPQAVSKRRPRIGTRSKAAQRLPELATGINGFDALSRGGLPRHRTTLCVVRHASVANSVLAAIPRKEYLGLMDGLEPVTLTHGAVLYEPDEAIAHVFFPVDCLVSLLTTVDARRTMEVGLVGKEGMVGIPLALGVEVSSVRALVQGTGTALRMNAARFREVLEQCRPLQREVHRYACGMLARARQSVACNQFHRLEARLARRLLMTSDRMPSEEFLLTQEFLADTLGVLRAAINRAAGFLQERKLIRYRRGKIRILKRKGLEAAACRCYEGPYVLQRT